MRHDPDTPNRVRFSENTTIPAIKIRIWDNPENTRDTLGPIHFEADMARKSSKTQTSPFKMSSPQLSIDIVASSVEGSATPTITVPAAHIINKSPHGSTFPRIARVVPSDVNAEKNPAKSAQISGDGVGMGISFSF